MGTATASNETFTYKRHEPEKTLLCRILSREWDTWFAERQADTDRSPLPAYVEREFEAYFRCGRPEFASAELGTAAVPVAVSSGSAICVTFADGTVRCAGNNSNGEGGFGSTSYYEPPATANVLNLGL